MDRSADTPAKPDAASGKRQPNLSKDGELRSFPNVPHLLQYTNSGTYYARTKVNGKLIRQSLRTDVWRTAKLRLTDFLKEQQEARGRVVAPKFCEAVGVFKRELESDTSLKPQSRKYRLWCLGKIQKTWPAL